jgi:hypothetical protein
MKTNYQNSSKAVRMELSEILANAKESQMLNSKRTIKKDYTTIIAVSILSLIPLAVFVISKFIDLN